MFVSPSRHILGGVTPQLGHSETQAFSILKLCLSAGLSTSWPQGGEQVSPGDGPGSGAPRSCPELSYMVTSCVLQEGPRNVVWPQAQEGKRKGEGVPKVGHLVGCPPAGKKRQQAACLGAHRRQLVRSKRWTNILINATSIYCMSTLRQAVGQTQGTRKRTKPLLEL